VLAEIVVEACCRLNQETRYSLVMPFGCLLKLWSKFSYCFKNVIHIQCWKLSAPYLPHVCLFHLISCNNKNNNSFQLGYSRLKTTQNAWHGLAEFLSTKSITSLRVVPYWTATHKSGQIYWNTNLENHIRHVIWLGYNLYIIWNKFDINKLDKN
jgi:hypothetical protein